MAEFKVHTKCDVCKTYRPCQATQVDDGELAYYCDECAQEYRHDDPCYNCGATPTAWWGTSEYICKVCSDYFSSLKWHNYDWEEERQEMQEKVDNWWETYPYNIEPKTRNPKYVAMSKRIDAVNESNIGDYKEASEKDAPDWEEEISEFCDRLKNTLIEKNRKYGNSVFNPISVFSKGSVEEQIAVRLDDKLKRIMQAEDDDDEDAWFDLIGYLVLKQVWKLSTDIT